MTVIFTGKSVQTSERERAYAERRLQRLDRYFRSVHETRVTHSEQRGFQCVEVQLDLAGRPLRAEARTPVFTISVDAVVEKLEHQVLRLKEKLRSHKGRAGAALFASVLAASAAEEAQSGETGPLPSVVRTKRFAIKPMTVDEASLQIELVDHPFFAFLNSESGEMNVLYRRRDGDFGLLELVD